MRYLISLPENTVEHFSKLVDLSDKQAKEWFCASDPTDVKVGSGGGTAWIIIKAWEN